jgi:hypothetical protein
VSAAQPGAQRVVAVTALALLAQIGFDFLLHGGVLASLYERPGGFLLPLAEAARRIPLGYLGFLALTVLLVRLLLKLGVRTAAAGALLGLEVGGLVWLALVLGLASVTTAPWDLLAGWWIGQTLELALAGAVAGAGLGAGRLRGIVWRVVGLVVVCVVLGVVLQNV